MHACRVRVSTSVPVDVSCACVTVVCVRSRACFALTYRVRARRVRVVTSVRAHQRLVCLCAVCGLSRACVRVDVSCACRAAYLSQEHVRFGPLVHLWPLYTYLFIINRNSIAMLELEQYSYVSRPMYTQDYIFTIRQ